MKMPRKIDASFFSPCGMNCMLCQGHLKERKACPGCLGPDEHKPDRCKNCAIKTCAHKAGVTYCHRCREFPCRSIKNLERSYTRRYRVSLIDNSRWVERKGIEAFQKSEKKKWTCGFCKGVINLHDGVCSECGKAAAVKLR